MAAYVIGKERRIILDKYIPNAAAERPGLTLVPRADTGVRRAYSGPFRSRTGAPPAAPDAASPIALERPEGSVRIARARRTQHMYAEALHTVPPGTILLEFDGGATRRLPRVGYGSFRAAINGRELCHGSRVEFGMVESSIESEALALCTGLYQTWLHLSVHGYEPSRMDVIVRGDCVDLVDALNAGDKRLAARTRAGFVTGAAVFRSIRGEWHGRENSVARFAH